MVLPAEETVRIPRPPKAGQKPGPVESGSPTVPRPVAPPAAPFVSDTPTMQVPRAHVPLAAPGPPPVRGPYVPPIVPPKSKPRKGIGDISYKKVQLIGAIVATLLTGVLIFVLFSLFSGDVPDKPAQPVVRQVAPVATAPTPRPTPTATPSVITLPPVPESKGFIKHKGTPAVVSGLINDKKTGLVYPRLAAPWDAKSFAPFTIAQRIGKVKIPHTMIVSAMFPGDAPASKPSKESDYRDIAVRAARWSLRTQFPAGSTIIWTGSKKLGVGKGWLLGYEVTYDGKTSQAFVGIVEVGKTKPGMLLATIPDTHKDRWADLNTLASQLRPL
ncbi:hypothetical protein OIE66_33935 [Nonomuraea sp. NBC_01738]|uniref:hypothetical protein n=1 Tax=Nonomuraea sp. NBC_01738 TaxID=2976003 RepID=UPI002E113AF2|nr:hypothetical protein OIE66_33935 [Nonomuraea sp. NBC_01738]